MSFAVAMPAGLLPENPCEPMVPLDLIARARAQFALPVVERPEVQRQLDWYVQHPQYFERVLTRAGKYLYFTVQELERRGMPGELAFLPIVESAFDPFAYSRSRASGLWQFIPGTGRVYGLRQDWWYDARRDVEASTLAALDYLEALGKLFEGNWLLAIAGYNTGEGNVIRAVRRNLQALRPTEFWDLKLPLETRAYVPKLLALKRIIADPAAFGLTLPAIPDTPYFVAVETGGQIDLALAAELAGLSMADLYALNPGHNRWTTPPDGPHRLLVPVANKDRLLAGLAELPPENRVRWQRHHIQRGESLGSIARHYRTTAAFLQQANRLSGSLIRAGDYLMIPSATASAEHYSMSEQARLQRAVNTPQGQLSHRVRRGDNLWSIARAHNVSTRELAKWNGMAPGDTLAVGRELVIWSSADAPVAVATGSATNKRIQYTVQRGDSLYRISTRFKVSVPQLIEWNSLNKNNYLQPGQRLVLYVDVTRQTG
ncbi:MAG: LysM peptidoglycan-binding domain-containing protein [Gammaproteobacteria bacterium]|nr:LysM peptidoglycan-binding domain-containing protein [Gammaproteobacteria bacterium]